MFRFANPYFLYLLVIVPIVIIAYMYALRNQQRRLVAFGNPDLLAQLMPNRSKQRPIFKFALTMLALTLVIIGLARPQFGSKVEVTKRQGIEAILVVDVSNSMLTQDVEPNRLGNAKLMLSKLMDQMSDDKIGLIVFSGDAFVQLPMTSDNVSAKMFLSTISPSLVPRPGTAIGTALDLAIRSFGPVENKEISRAIILITDGENHEDDAVAAAKLAEQRGIVVHVIGIGSPQGGPIPVGGTLSFRKDNDGNVVVSKLNEEMCRSIAESGKGIYVRADNSSSAYKAISKEIDAMQKGEIDGKSYSEYAEQFFVFVWIALFVLLLDFFIMSRRNKKLEAIKLFDKPDQSKNS